MSVIEAPGECCSAFVTCEPGDSIIFRNFGMRHVSKLSEIRCLEGRYHTANTLLYRTAEGVHGSVFLSNRK
eukprot:scaffold91075_cov17-Prasinocladus_malaysianus.AAC.1